MWRPAGVLYLALCLAGLAAGLFPEVIVPWRHGVRAAPVPALAGVAVGQVAFIFLVYPLVWMRRSLRGSEKVCPLVAGLESSVLMLVAVPLYAAGAWFADAVVIDVVRVALYVGLLWPVAWAAGAWLARGTGRTVVLLVLSIAALGLPAAWYIVAEFMPARSIDWLWFVAPATAAWSAAARTGAVIPSPLWSWLAWPALAAVAGLALLLLPRRAGNAPPSES